MPVSKIIAMFRRMTLLLAGTRYMTALKVYERTLNDDDERGGSEKSLTTIRHLREFQPDIEVVVKVST